MLATNRVGTFSGHCETSRRFGDSSVQDNFIPGSLEDAKPSTKLTLGRRELMVDTVSTVTKVNNGVFVIKVRRKLPIIRRKKKLRALANFVEDKNDLKFLNHLNERIQNPVFKSKYPKRKPRIK